MLGFVIFAFFCGKVFFLRLTSILFFSDLGGFGALAVKPLPLRCAEESITELGQRRFTEGKPKQPLQKNVHRQAAKDTKEEEEKPSTDYTDFTDCGWGMRKTGTRERMRQRFAAGAAGA